MSARRTASHGAPCPADRPLPCKWEYGYVPGEGYRRCPKCGAVERVSPEGAPSRAPAALAALVRRRHAVSVKAPRRGRR